MRRWVYPLLAAAALLLSTDASAFCRKTTCRTCPLDPDTGCTVGGQPLVWPGACVSYALSRHPSVQVNLADALQVASEAFGAWQAVTCPGTGEHPSINASDALGSTGCNLAEFSRTGANANVVLFRDDEWPYADAEDAVGLTTVSFDSVTGEIFDADVEVNGTVPLSATDAVPPEYYDLRSILTHEAGHFLGLAHSEDPLAVMRPSYDPGTDSLRVLADDDILGICSIYPPERRALPCDFTPRDGFASECPLGVFRGGCALALSHPPRRRGALLVLFCAGGALMRRGATRSRRRRAGRTQGALRDVT